MSFWANVSSYEESLIMIPFLSLKEYHQMLLYDKTLIITKTNIRLLVDGIEKTRSKIYLKMGKIEFGEIPIHDIKGMYTKLDCLKNKNLQ